MQQNADISIHQISFSICVDFLLRFKMTIIKTLKEKAIIGIQSPLSNPIPNKAPRIQITAPVK